MSLAAEPRPAQLPLEGGRKDATVELHPLLCARMIGPPAMFHREEGWLAALKALGVGVPRREWMEVPVVAFLVKHPGAGWILVDTGFHESVSVDPGQGMGRFGGLIFKDVKMEASQSVPAQLRERGIQPADIGTVIMTHLHSDHASGISEFGESTFVLSAREWEAAGDGGQLDGYLKHQYDHAFEYRTLDFDGTDSDSYATFGRSFDLFGDGSVVLVYTPGHTHGHLAVILRLKEREALIAGDAIYTMKTLRDTHVPYKMADEHRFRRSLREIQLYVENNPDALIIPGHDMEHWRTLEPSYS
jgi:N-acyl homoserine lactone hydrolase